jgi:hypothetical protein
MKLPTAGAEHRLVSIAIDCIRLRCRRLCLLATIGAAIPDYRLDESFQVYAILHLSERNDSTSEPKMNNVKK